MAIAALALTACKKDNVDETQMGSATINGTVRADIDQTNDINGAGLYEQYLSPEGVSGMVVTVEVSTEDWDSDPNGNYDYETMTYTTTTDANGNFTLTIPATQEGYDIEIMFTDVHGVTRKLYSTDGNTVQETSGIGLWTRNEFIYDGANLTVVYDADYVYAENNDTYDYGYATVSGVLYGNWDQSNGAPNNFPFPYVGAERYGTGSPLEGKKLYWGYDWAPYGVGYDNITEVNIETDGTFSFQVPTYPSSYGGSVDIYFGFYDVDDFVIINNMAGTADSLDPAIFTSGGIQGVYVYGLTDGEVRDASFEPGINYY